MVKIADFIEAPNSGGNYRKVLLVVHLTISPEVKGAARGVVAFWNRGRTGSTQYVVDNAEIIQAVRETAYAWAAGTTANRWGIHVEHCGMLQTLRQWRDGYSTAELELSAPLFAELAKKYRIPIRWLTVEQIRHAVKTGNPADGGLCTHADITEAFPGETSHTDPGRYFPKGHFLNLVERAADRHPAHGSHPKPETVDYKIDSINLGAGTDADKLADLEDLVAAGAHAIGVQEAGDRHPMLHQFLAAHPLWAMFMRTTSGGGKVPILYDTTVFELDVDYSRVVEEWGGGQVGDVGAGPGELDPKGLTHAAFTHLASGRRVHLLNHHLIASHGKRVHQGRLIPKAERIKRAAVAAQQADAFEREAERCHGIVHGTGDWNASKKWVEDHVDGYRVDNTGATFRRSQYDHIGHFPDPNVTVVGQRVLETSGSRKNHDHRAVLVTYRTTIKEKP